MRMPPTSPAWVPGTPCLLPGCWGWGWRPPGETLLQDLPPPAPVDLPARPVSRPPPTAGLPPVWGFGSSQPDSRASRAAAEPEALPACAEWPGLLGLEVPLRLPPRRMVTLPRAELSTWEGEASMGGPGRGRSSSIWVGTRPLALSSQPDSGRGLPGPHCHLVPSPPILGLPATTPESQPIIWNSQKFLFPNSISGAAQAAASPKVKGCHPVRSQSRGVGDWASCQSPILHTPQAHSPPYPSSAPLWRSPVPTSGAPPSLFLALWGRWTPRVGVGEACGGGRGTRGRWWSVEQGAAGLGCWCEVGNPQACPGALPPCGPSGLPPPTQPIP